VPFIAVFPPKWEHLNPWGEAGSTTEELVNFDDLAPTMLSLVDHKKADWMTGRAMLGPHREEPADFIYCSRNRIDETEACSRSLTDGRYLYTRHFLPGPEYKLAKYFDVADISKRLRKANQADQLSDVQGRMFEPQPHEVLYDLKTDPWEINNLANESSQASRLESFRKKLREHIVSVRDVMIRPEYELGKISQDSTPYEYGQTVAKEKLRSVLEAAAYASQPDAKEARLRELLNSDDETISYWAATAYRRDPKYDRGGLEARDIASYPARIEIAAALYRYDGDETSFRVLANNATGQNPYLRMQALQRIQELGAKAAPFKDILEQALTGGTYETQCSAEMTLHILDGREISYPDPS
jgi:hypothetical protein